MLVMVTLFVGTSESLPETSYAKMIDIWMIFCLISTFAEIVIQTLIEYFKADEDEREVMPNLVCFRFGLSRMKAFENVYLEAYNFEKSTPQKPSSEFHKLNLNQVLLFHHEM